ncbi:efflux RND transporter periplasmic adaptor subunit [Algoriphagus sediminis]|uniref:Efflux RND transporter periplasmic adaptor subunit n=1 Tax=Algoriphagus sediminis TaxID=3057113 RepID=A0ABT7Y8F3_9BACT|nr:efflux RND transporter periplasmic adaptor subunit [Algoriphagus sediminis]MDN3202793.1 efflux RND transporter periplasmic adaptor subunit [Algoriphagus sediminis]
MKTTLKTLPILALTGLIYACGGAAEESPVETKVAELAELRNQASELQMQIQELEKEISTLDPDFAQANKKSILITTAEVKQGKFQHFVELTGSVLSKKNVSISSESQGTILEIPVTEGMRVNRGQLLARIDSEVIQKNIDELETTLDLATTLYEKQARLWEQEIGTEIQYLEAKNRKESLERSLASLETQLSKTMIRAPFTGTIETVNVRLGELVQPGAPMFQFIGESDLYIEADVSETYIGVIDKGDSVNVYFPNLDKKIATKVSSVGAVINPNNRTFKVEVFLPNMANIKPNMISVLEVRDYENEDAIVVPSHLILSDNRGDYVYAVEDGIAKKKYVDRGQTYDMETEILSGLNAGEVLVDKGFREVGDNFNVNIAQL